MHCYVVWLSFIEWAVAAATSTQSHRTRRSPFPLDSVRRQPRCSKGKSRAIRHTNSPERCNQCNDIKPCIQFYSQKIYDCVVCVYCVLLANDVYNFIIIRFLIENKYLFRFSRIASRSDFFAPRYLHVHFSMVVDTTAVHSTWTRTRFVSIEI